MANESQRRKVVETSYSSGACVECFTEYILIKTQDADSVISQGRDNAMCQKTRLCVSSVLRQPRVSKNAFDWWFYPADTEISTVQILMKELISGLSLFCLMRVIHCKVFFVACGSRRTWAGRQSSNASRWWDNCHKHALFVQLAQTRLSFDIWLVLSRGTAAGCRKESAGKTVTVSADGSACCACSGAFGDFGLFLHGPHSLATPNVKSARWRGNRRWRATSFSIICFMVNFDFQSKFHKTKMVQSQVCSGLEGNLIMTKCSNTHNSLFILQKSFSSTELFTYLCQKKRTVARATSVLPPRQL